MMEIRRMTQENINEYAKLFMEVFNAAPWNDQWTMETATTRIEYMMSAKTFIGLVLYEGECLSGMIYGQKEQYYNGMQFQIQEFCVDTKMQGMGCGSRLLNELTGILKEQNISSITLLTSRGLKTEGFYSGKGFQVAKNMIFMYKKI